MLQNRQNLMPFIMKWTS